MVLCRHLLPSSSEEGGPLVHWQNKAVPYPFVPAIFHFPPARLDQYRGEYGEIDWQARLWPPCRSWVCGVDEQHASKWPANPLSNCSEEQTPQNKCLTWLAKGPNAFANLVNQAIFPPRFGGGIVLLASEFEKPLQPKQVIAEFVLWSARWNSPIAQASVAPHPNRSVAVLIKLSQVQGPIQSG